MTKISLVTLVFTLCAAASASGGGSAEGTAHGKYLAGQGIIVPAENVHVNSHIASVDYLYPKPIESAVGVTLYSGNRQLVASGQEELIHIGIQAGEVAFEDLEPMNLAFVIDKSGSMQSEGKMDWVKDAFDVFIERVRDTDFVSLVVFANDAQVVFQTTKMTRENRLRFQSAVLRVEPGGGTNLVAGLELGYQQVMANYRSEYTNRVLFLTDGVGESGGILEIAEQFRELGINVSTIGVGSDFDVNLMVELAKRGGGSSRFISDREEMEEIFGTELDRMVVPAVYDLTMRLELPRSAEALESWGYNHEILGREVRFFLPTLHHRDYETILVRVKTPSVAPGRGELARFTVSYRDAEGSDLHDGPFVLNAEYVDTVAPVSGFSSGMVLRSGTMLHFAQALITIGDLYYSCQDEISEVNSRRDELFRQASSESDSVSYEGLTNPEIEKLEDSVRAKMRRAMDLTIERKNELANARLRLDNEGFDDEILILERYVEIIGGDMEESEDDIARLKQDVEISPQVSDRSFEDHIANLFREIGLSLPADTKGTIAVAGFSGSTGDSNALIEVLNEMALLEMSNYETLTVVERAKLSAVIEEQKLSLSGLVDTDTAIEVGKLLSAQLVLTGTVIVMPSSVVVFGRIIDVESSEVRSVAQVIIPKSAEISRMLAS